MRSPLVLTLSLGLLGGCTLYFDEPGDPGDSVDPDPDPGTPPRPEPPTPAEQTRTLLAEWSGCLSLTNFTSASMAPTWSAIPASNGGMCTTCHLAASPTFPISSDPAAFFRALSEHSKPMLDFFAVDLATRPGKVIVNPHPYQAVATGTPPYEAHPRFSVAGAPTTALAKLYSATAARKAAGTCDPPRLLD